MQESNPSSEAPGMTPQSAGAEQIPGDPQPREIRLRINEVDRILKERSFSTSKVALLYLPKIVASAKLGQLSLKVRTRHCMEELVGEGIIDEAPDLARVKISHLFRTENFGKLSFVDLLTGLRPYMLDGDPARTAGPPELLRTLEKLRNSTLCARIRCDDPRFKSQLAPLLTIANSSQPTATAATEGVNDLAARLATGVFAASEAKRALACIRELRQAVRSCVHLRLERELHDVVRGELDERTTRAVLRVYGLDGRGGATLQQVANEFALTRERIRQITDRIIRVVKLRPFVPKLEACLRLINSKLPNRADIIEKTLVSTRLTQTEFKLDGLRTAAELFNKPIRFEIAEANGVRVAVKIQRASFASEVLMEARRCVSKSGVSAVSTIADALREEEESVAGVLTTEPNIRWLGEGSNWFFIVDSRRNRLLNLIRKVASVAPTVAIGDLRTALAKNYRLAAVPPRAVLADFCRECGWEVEGDVATFSFNPPTEQELSETESRMVSTLRAHGPTLYRTEFQELCAKKGISRNTFSMYLWTNPLFSRVATGVYALTGADVSPVDVENCLRRNRASVPAIADCGWTSAAKPWVALQMSPTIVASGVFPVPGSIRHFLLGRFTVETTDGREIGRIQVAEQNSWGLGMMIRRCGIEPGDFVVLEFNLQDRRVRAYLGGPEIVESFCEKGSA